MSESLVTQLREISEHAVRTHAGSSAGWTAELATRVQRARRRRGAALTGVAAALTVGIAVGGATPDRGTAPVPPVASHADATPVVGTAVCHFGNQASDTVDGVLVLTIDVTCDLTTSDPRASGTEHIVLVDRLLDPEVGAMWTAEGVLTTSGGTWRGTGSGAVDLQGNLPALEGYAPFDHGRVHYLGEGAYEGLELTYFLAGTNVGPRPGYDVAGWIEPTG